MLGPKEEENRSDVTLLASSAALDSHDLRERNYMGLSDCSSVDGSGISAMPAGLNKSTLNLKATELRLGLPGSQSPKRGGKHCLLISSTKLDEKPLFPLHPLKNGSCSSSSQKKIHALGTKRGFSAAMEENFFPGSEVNVIPSSRPRVTQPVKFKDKAVEKTCTGQEKSSKEIESLKNQSCPPETKAQVVGWPPIRSFRKNSMANNSANANEVDEKAGLGTPFIKVSMDGAPYLRKVDLSTYTTYQGLSSALEKMFGCFTIGSPSKGVLSMSNLKDILNGLENVLTYEDKDGDWMLVGDVPWEMFVSTCNRLRIMKSSDAIGLAPRAMEKRLHWN